MNKTITPASELQAKIEATRYDYFTLPTLEVTVKYRKPDLLKLSLNKQLPAMMAELIIKGYRDMTNGVDPKAYEKELAEQAPKADNQFLESARDQGYQLLSDLCVSHAFLNVPESDFESLPVPVIAWKDVPENDALAFIFGVVNEAQVVQTDNGGEISSTEILDFPDGEQVSKRGNPRASRKAVR